MKRSKSLSFLCVRGFLMMAAEKTLMVFQCNGVGLEVAS